MEDINVSDNSEKGNGVVEIMIQLVIKKKIDEARNLSLLLKAMREELTTEEMQEVLTSPSVNSSNRFEIYLMFAPHLPDVVFWKGLRDAYLLSNENDRIVYKDLFKFCFSSSRRYRSAIMNQLERIELFNLPDMVHIFRPMTKTEALNEKYGISWTLSPNMAESNAQCHNENMTDGNETDGNEVKVVRALKVPKSSIVALFDKGFEKEIIYIGDRSEQ